MTTTVDSSVRARIDALAGALADADSALAEAFSLRGAVIELLALADVPAPELRLPADYIRARLAAGTPLLDGIDLPVSAAASALFERLAVAMLADPAAHEAAEVILTAVRSHRLHAEQVVGEAVVSHGDHLESLAEAAAVDGPLLATLADVTARPLLTSVAQRLRPALKLAPWARGWCPICGARPAFAERLTGSDELALRCGRCTTSWAWTLPSCPDCRVGSLSLLQALDITGVGDWTVHGCDRCRSYLKVASGPRGDNLGHLLVDDLATWNLDRAALAAGYRPPADAGRRLEHGDPGGEDLGDD